MPILILILALVAFVLIFRNQDPYATPSSSALQDVQNQMTNAAIAHMQNQTAGVQLTSAQAAQLNKFKAIASIAGTATTVGVAGLSSLTLAAAGPIGATVAAVVIAIGALRGTAHLVANEWTKPGGVQDNFGKALAAINLEFANAVANGSASKDMAKFTVNAYNNLWNQYVSIAEQFAAVDKDHREVIDNSYCDFKGINCRKGKTPLLTVGLVNALINGVNENAAKLRV
jgi:hypothetical protein